MHAFLALTSLRDVPGTDLKHVFDGVLLREIRTLLLAPLFRGLWNDHYRDTPFHVPRSRLGATTKIMESCWCMGRSRSRS